MCGIVGYIGPRQAAGLLIDGLRRMEYRGYDSAGLAIVNGHGVEVVKAAGKLDNLEQRLQGATPNGTLGIGHTRWATHGAPTTTNAHPHTDQSGRIAVIHNGIIENAGALRKALEGRGHVFKSETDTEVLAHLVGELYAGNLEDAVAAALRDVDGAYGLAFVSADEPGVLVAARKGSPLLVGVGDGEFFVASDASALLEHTRSVVYLDDGELAVLSRDGYRIRNLETDFIDKPVNQIEWDLATIERGGFDHFMLKEIFEQPESLENTLRGHLLDDEGSARVHGLNMTDEELKQINRIVITACGTSWHAGLIGEYMLEELARIPVEVEYASEFRYRNPVVDERTLVIAISQSGETADTLAAIHEAKLRGARTLGLVNVVGSTIAREVDGGLYLRAGPEVGVASHQGIHEPGGGAHAGDAQAGAAPEPRDHAGPRDHRGAAEDPGADQGDPGSRARDRGAGGAVLAVEQRALPGPRGELPGGARGRAQAQGDLLHPRRGISRRRR